MSNESDEDERDDDEKNEAPARRAAPPAAPAPPPAQRGPSPLLGRLLSMAQRSRQDGNDRQAAEMLWKLAEEHPESLEAATAKAELMAMAEHYEKTGNVRQARGMYERLMALEE